MDPIPNQAFDYGYIKYVYQQGDPQSIHRNLPPDKPFKIKSPKKSEKTKKDLKKQSPSDGAQEPKEQ